MSPSFSNSPWYRSMIKAVTAALDSGVLNAQRVVEYERVKTYWSIGQSIVEGEAASDGAMVITPEFYKQVALDINRALPLKIKPDTVGRCIQFHRTYPKFPSDTPLTFTHYLALMRVSDPVMRRKLEREAAAQRLSSPQLRQRVLEYNNGNGEKPADTVTLPLERGEPYVYQVRPYEDLLGRPYAGVDCGFRMSIPLEGGPVAFERPSFAVEKVRYVRSVRADDGKYAIRLAVRKRAAIYTYAARVLHVVDGDTFDALIDVGFGLMSPGRIRLKGINAPEVDTPAGQAAKAFLTEQLRACPLIVVRTAKTGIFGRWLGDVFGLTGSTDPAAIAAQGNYINQIMLDHGHAELYRG